MDGMNSLWVGQGCFGQAKTRQVLKAALLTLGGPVCTVGTLNKYQLPSEPRARVLVHPTLHMASKPCSAIHRPSPGIYKAYLAGQTAVYTPLQAKNRRMAAAGSRTLDKIRCESMASQHGLQIFVRKSGQWRVWDSEHIEVGAVEGSRGTAFHSKSGSGWLLYVCTSS